MQSKVRTSATAETSQETALKVCSQCRQDHVLALELNKYSQVHLIALPQSGRSLYFYKARIPSEFLDKFDMPSRFSAHSPVVISYYPIPLLPTERLTTELDHALCSVQQNAMTSPLTEDTQQGDGGCSEP